MSEGDAARHCESSVSVGPVRIYVMPNGALVTFDDRWPTIPVEDKR